MTPIQKEQEIIKRFERIKEALRSPDIQPEVLDNAAALLTIAAVIEEKLDEICDDVHSVDIAVGKATETIKSLKEEFRGG